MLQKLVVVVIAIFSVFWLKAQNLSISEVQGDALSSPYEGQTVSLDSVVVTATGDNGFFVQSRPGQEDGDILTSEGLRVYLGNASGLQPGDLLNISGNIQEFAGETEISGSGTDWEVIATNQALPDPVALNANFPSKQLAPIPDLERVEGMRIIVTDATICSPGTAFEEAGFYLSEKRPFREAGIPTPGINGLPIWDNNPELIFFDAGYTDTNNERLASGMKLNASGVLSIHNDHYLLLPTTYQLTGELSDRRAKEKTAGEVSIGCLNALFLDSDSSPDNIIHRQQIAIYILDGMKAPNIVAVQEVENIQAMQDVANRIRDLDPSVDYEVYLEGTGSSPINLGYFVDKTIIDVTLEQLGRNETLSIGGRMHDRPPFLLRGAFATDPPTPIQLLNVHLKSLNGITGGNASGVRTKRHEAAISVARMVQDRQDQNLMVLGDFNAFQFSDGYVDVVNQISGQPSLGAERPVEPVVDPPLMNLSTTVAEEDRYSYVFRGNAQILDHCLSNEMDGLVFKELQFIRGNADNPDLYVNNPQTPQFSSDHDGFVVYFDLVDTLISVGNTETLNQDLANLQFPNPIRLGDLLSFTPSERGVYSWKLLAADGRLLDAGSLGNLAGEQVTYFSLDEQVSPGIYVLEISGENYRRTEKVIISHRF